MTEQELDARIEAMLRQALSGRTLVTVAFSVLSLWYLGVSLWRAVVVGACVGICLTFRVGDFLVRTVVAALLAVALAQFVGIHLTDVKTLIAQVSSGIFQN